MMQNFNQTPTFQRYLWNKELELLQRDLLCVKYQLGLQNKLDWTVNQKKRICQTYLCHAFPWQFYNQRIEVIAALYAMMRVDYDGEDAPIFFEALLNAWNFIPTFTLNHYKDLTDSAKRITLMENVDAFLPWFKQNHGKVRYDLTTLMYKTVRYLMQIRLSDANRSEIFYEYMVSSIPKAVIYDEFV